MKRVHKNKVLYLLKISLILKSLKKIMKNIMKKLMKKLAKNQLKNNLLFQNFYSQQVSVFQHSSLTLLKKLQQTKTHRPKLLKNKLHNQQNFLLQIKIEFKILKTKKNYNKVLEMIKVILTMKIINKHFKKKSKIKNQQFLH